MGRPEIVVNGTLRSGDFASAGSSTSRSHRCLRVRAAAFIVPLIIGYSRLAAAASALGWWRLAVGGWQLETGTANWKLEADDERTAGKNPPPPRELVRGSADRVVPETKRRTRVHSGANDDAPGCLIYRVGGNRNQARVGVDVVPTAKDLPTRPRADHVENFLGIGQHSHGRHRRRKDRLSGEPGGPLRAYWPGRASGSCGALGSRRPLRSGRACPALGSGRSLRASRSSRSHFSLRSYGAGVTLFSLCTGRSLRTFGARSSGR